MVAAIGAAGAVGSAAVSANGASSAAGQQGQAAANSQYMNNFEQAINWTNQMPFLNAGQWAAGQLQGNLQNGTLGGAYPGMNSSFTPQDYLNNKDPGYDFQLQQGQQALQNSQAAGSGVLSGAALKGLIGYNQGMASTGYQNAYNRWLSTNQNNYSQWLGSQQNTYGQLSGLASLGENSAAQTGNSGVGYGSNISGSINAGGNAAAAGTVGTANALSSGISNGAGYYALSGLLGGGSNSDTGFNGQSNPANQQGLTNLMNQYA